MTEIAKEDNNPKLYCGTYGKYNNGSIKGKWMDLSEYDTAEEFFEACAELHKDEHDPEFMFQDFECFPESLYSESMSAKDVQTIIDYAKLDDDQKELAEAFYEATGYDLDDYTIEQIEDAHVFTTDNSSFASTETQLGWHYKDSGLIDIPENIEHYFDFEAFGRDCMMDLSEHNGYVFDLNAI